MVVGGLVKRAAEKLKADLLSVSPTIPQNQAGLKKAAAKLLKKEVEKIYEVEYEKPPEIAWDDATYRGDAYGVYSYAAVVVDLEIDKTTFEVTVHGVTTAQDIGRAINPLFAEGQIIGGTTQGLGYALLESPVYKNGVMINNQLTNYIIPTALDTPPMDVAIIERPYSRGPFGAKGVGELPMDAPGPAVAAAVYHATGALMTELPILPERLLEALA
jgi:CO/xanthine dehydrogenase Mo-binding subunit